MENVRGVSNVHVVPRMNNVLIRMEFTASIIAITSGKYDSETSESVIMTVAGIGPHVKDLEVGEKVMLELTNKYDSVEVDGNENSIKALKAKFEAMPKSELTELMKNPSTSKVQVVQYGLFADFHVKAHL